VTFVIVSVNGAVFSVISTKSSAERRPQEVRQHPSTPQPSAEKADRPSHRNAVFSRGGLLDDAFALGSLRLLN
jgi:hypothetical protein